MKKEFRARVLMEGIVDTKNYRYILNGCRIQRLKIKYLDTTAALDSWETVEVIK